MKDSSILELPSVPAVPAGHRRARDFEKRVQQAIKGGHNGLIGRVEACRKLQTHAQELVQAMSDRFELERELGRAEARVESLSSRIRRADGEVLRMYKVLSKAKMMSGAAS